MAVGANTPPATEFDLTIAEEWAVHEAFVDYIRRTTEADNDRPAPVVELTILERIRDGEWHFTDFELDRIKYELEHYATGGFAAPADREAACAVVRKIEATCRGSGGT